MKLCSLHVAIQFNAQKIHKYRDTLLVNLLYSYQYGVTPYPLAALLKTRCRVATFNYVLPARSKKKLAELVLFSDFKFFSKGLTGRLFRVMLCTRVHVHVYTGLGR